MGKTRNTSLILLIQKACENQKLYLIIMRCEDFIFKKENISLNPKLKLKSKFDKRTKKGRSLKRSTLNIATKRSTKKKIEKIVREKDSLRR